MNNPKIQAKVDTRNRTKTNSKNTTEKHGKLKRWATQIKIPEDWTHVFVKSKQLLFRL